MAEEHPCEERIARLERIALWLYEQAHYHGASIETHGDAEDLINEAKDDSV